MPSHPPGFLEDGVWRPWRHPDYRSSAHELQGWWRKSGTDEVIAVLGHAGTTKAGDDLFTCSKYDFNEGARGSSFRMGRARLERDYEREADDLDPRH